MPSLAAHMAIAILYMKKNKIKDKKAFMDGIKEPDYIAMQGQEQKEKAHFTDQRIPGLTTKDHMQRKVNLFDYFSQRKIDTDFEKGYALHLLSDFLFFYHFFPYKKLEEQNLEFKTVYDDYEKIAKLMEEKYGVENSGTPWEGHYQEGEPILFSKKEICDFVENVSNLNLEKIRNITLSSKENWKENVTQEFLKQKEQN